MDVSQALLFASDERTAEFDDTGRFRYHYRWSWEPGPSVLFIGLNPSTATPETPDATCRKWRGFAKGMECGGFSAVNLFAYRSRDPRGLRSAIDTIGGPHNDETIRKAVMFADTVVVCWGRLPASVLRYRVTEVRDLLRDTMRPIKCWGLTADGQPRHPLMLPYATPLQDFAP